MRLSTATLPYGDGVVPVSIPEPVRPEWILYDRTPAADLPEAEMLARAGNAPYGARLSSLARGRSRAVVLISDISRLCPSDRVLPYVIGELEAGGMRDGQIRIVVALGMHRKMTDDELRRLVGPEIRGRFSVENHSSLPEDCVHVGTTSRGTPVEINRTVAEADLRVAVGNIEPHGLVGMSGGVKALVPGVASSRCIEHNHGLSQSGKATPGSTANPVHADLEEAHRLLPLHYLYNVVVDHERRLLGAFAGGDTAAAHTAGMAFSRSRFLVPHDRRYDVVLVSPGGRPKDMQLYQAIKTLQNAAKLAKPGGAIVLVAECREIYGNGVLQTWAETIADRARIVRMLQERFVLGAHKIGHLDAVLRDHPVYLYSEVPDAIAALLGFRPVRDLDAAVAELFRDRGLTCAVVPAGALTFPVAAPVHSG